MIHATVGLDASNLAASDGLTDIKVASPGSGHPVHPAQFHRRVIRKLDPQENGFWILQVRMLLENPNWLTAKAYDEVSRFELFNQAGSVRSVQFRVFWNTREHHFNSCVGSRSAHQRSNQGATGERKDDKGKRQVKECKTPHNALVSVIVNIQGRQLSACTVRQHKSTCRGDSVIETVKRKSF
jgi:hypothetical protein